MTWRLMIRYGRSEKVLDLPDVEALRQAVGRLRADPQVDSYRYRRLPEVREREHCPRCGNTYEPSRVHSWPCRCGWTHVTYDCYSCRLVDVDPPRFEECADLPTDTEGVNDRYSRKRWRSIRPD